jgi:hypothetical protein
MQSTRVAFVCLLAAAGPLSAQSLPMYLDISRAQVKSDRIGQFEEAGRKIVDMNRRLKGDRWIALSTEYGDSGTYMFSSSRQNMAAIETGMEAFMHALKEGMGPMANKFLQDVTGNTTSFKSELRRRRWDLSVHAPADAAAMNDLLGHTRWIRTIRIDVKPGRQMEYIEAWKQFQAELAEDSPGVVIVSESATGTPAMFAAMYYKSLAQMDEEAPAMQKAVASTAYRNFMKVTGDAVAMTNWEIHRVRPDLSNPPDEVLNADPSFWKPQTEATTASATKKSAAADREKK